MKTVQVRKATTGREKIIGLIGKQSPYPLLIETRCGIHTFGVTFPIDVLIVDNNYVVMAIYHHMKPNRIFFWNPKYKLVIELPDQTIRNEKIKLGDPLELVIK